MKNKGKIFIAQMLAGILAFSFVATSCELPGGPSGYQENGTTVKFDYNDGSSRPYSVLAVDGESVAIPTTPVREGYEFSHWQTEKDGGDVVSFPYTPTSNVTLYAAWAAKNYTVTFDMNYNNDKDIEKSVAYGETVEAPTASQMPTRNGYEFFEWQNKPEGGDTVSFPYTVKKDVTLYAIWSTGGIYTIKIDANYDGGESFEDLKVMAGKKIENKSMPKPKRDGYTFKGWALSEDATASDIVKFPYEPADSLTLYAVWEKISYIITYKYNMIGGDSVGFAQYKNLYYGDTIPQPDTTPTRPGYTFAGWYTTSQGGEPVDFTKKVERTMNIYAHWTSGAVTTDTFHAEFTEFDPLEEFPGYSGAAYGAGVISAQGSTHSGIIHNASDYQTNSVVTTSEGHFVTYLYKRGATVRFKIYSTADTTVTLQANLATEFVTGVTVGPTGDYAWQVKVNGTDLNYSPISFSGTLNAANNSSPFALYTLGTINLKQGENVIEFITANDNHAIGGTTRAFAPMMDCIKLTGGSASLSYHPVYDNLWYNALT